MKKGKENNEAPGGIDAMFLDTRVDNETTQKNTHTIFMCLVRLRFSVYCLPHLSHTYF
jgi:hypothetical protein